MINKISKSLVLFLTLATFAIPSFADSNVFRAQFTTQVSDREPADNISKLESSFTSVYFFTDIRDCIGCKVEHQWYLNGKHYYTNKSTSKYARYRYWSKVTLNDQRVGNWTVKVVINGKVRLVKRLTYYKPSQEQQLNAPIEKRLQHETLNECEEKLKYFHEQAKKNPNDPYYDFMLRKWGARCYGE